MKRVSWAVFALVIGLVLLAGSAPRKTHGPTDQILSPSGPSPAAEEKNPLPRGRQVYDVSMNTTGPKMTHVVIDPYDPKRGSEQEISVRANFSSPIDSIRLAVVTDSGESVKTLLSRASGTVTDGTWEARYPFPDTYERVYKFEFSLRAASGATSSNVIIVRDLSAP